MDDGFFGSTIGRSGAPAPAQADPGPRPGAIRAVDDWLDARLHWRRIGVWRWPASACLLVGVLAALGSGSPDALLAWLVFAAVFAVGGGAAHVYSTRSPGSTTWPAAAAATSTTPPSPVTGTVAPAQGDGMLSPDGNWLWTGTAWEPVPRQAAPAPEPVPFVPAAYVPAAAAFDASRPPAPGDVVPADCVWARVPYPGPVRAALATGPSHRRLQSLGELVGRPYVEIAHHAGHASTMRDMPHGRRAGMWKGSNFWSSSTEEMWLLFDRYGVCADVEHHDSRANRGGSFFGVVLDL